jgi:uncharacterized membrane protein YvlD (DUF360 family)
VLHRPAFPSGSRPCACRLFGLINAFVWPLIIRIALPLTVLTLGLGVIVLNGAMVLLVAAIEPGLKVSSLLAGIVVALGVTIVNVAVTSLLAIDDDDFWYRNVAGAKRAASESRNGRTFRACSSSRSTGSRTTCSCGRFATATPR